MAGADEFMYGDNTCRFSKTPQNILIIKRPRSPNSTILAVELAITLTKVYDAVVYCEDEAIHDMKAINPDLELNSISQTQVDLGEIIDLAISLGGDGTLLWLSHLFQTSVPPVISIAMGSLGYMSLFHYSKANDIVDRIMRKQTFAVSLRSRLTLYVPQENGDVLQTSCLNECVFERGNRHCLASIDVYCSGSYFTRVFADGLILATPSGSTAYSMSAGGSIVHPKVSGILFTPICPHTLSFRPVILPGSTELLIHVPESSRNGVQVALDGRRVAELKIGQFAAVTMCSYPLPLVICPQIFDFNECLTPEFELKSKRRTIDSTYTYQDILQSIREVKTMNSLGTDEHCIYSNENQIFVCPCCRKPDNCYCGIEKDANIPQEDYVKKKDPVYKEDYWLDSLNNYLDWNSQRTAQIPIDLQETVSGSKYSEFQSSLRKKSAGSSPRNLNTDRKIAPPETLKFLEQVRVIWKHDNEFKHECLPDFNNSVTCLNSKLRYSSPSAQKTTENTISPTTSGDKLENTVSIHLNADFDSSNWSQKSNNTDSTVKSNKSKTPFFTPVKTPSVIILDRKL
ncbi:inorganic polyphosphate ATP-NAD kinase [Cryptosporidium ubiquitum]|uniref:Inorganic polyphosphate ATP-NAD kinase n=1 Tax=Cryptosporidium ubiquitum TaxID=857276 RepID=A0A1J4MJJ3_9CRYT|nr:inorganic polyphosphate ATP-NAD kinase [Cryptosporidium ubiquitum]OII73627.1 inorganic polyphosphate ATP-NAD kinase [Cryptosporidium ubiquitum]